MFSLILDYHKLSNSHLSLEQNCKEYGLHYHNLSLEQKKLLNTTKANFIIVLGGGTSYERSVSFLSCESVINSLIQLGYYVFFIDVQHDIVKILSNISGHFKILNLVHGKWGEDGCLQATLNILHIQYTGSGVLASATSFNKKIAYNIAKSNGITVNDYKILHKDERSSFYTQNLTEPLIIKPTNQGSSIGVELLMPQKNFKISDDVFKYSDEIILEKFINGQELQVVMFEGNCWGILELKLLKNKKIYDYQTKYNIGFAEHIYPAHISEQTYFQIKDTSEKIYSIFGFKGLVRIEFIYTKYNHKLYFLEVNTVPGMTNTSICPEIASHVGINYDNLVEKMLEFADYEK